MKIEQLTFTRFLAAVAIVVFHYGRDIYPFDSYRFIVNQANFGVSYFFVLSGFVMAIAYGNQSQIRFGRFIQKRFARIYPVYLLAILLLMYILKNDLTAYKYDIYWNLSLFQSWIPSKALSFNFPAWSLSVEMFFYIVFPLVFNYIYKRLNPKYSIIIVVIFFIISQIVLMVLRSGADFLNPSSIFVNHGFIYYSPIMHLNEFLVGNIAGLFLLSKIKQKNYDIHIVIVFVLIILTLKYNSVFELHNGMLALLFVPLILLLSANNGILTKLLTMKLPVFLGEISYGIYILQYPVNQLWTLQIAPCLNVSNATCYFYLYLLFLIILSAISYKIVEVPLRRLINEI